MVKTQTLLYLYTFVHVKCRLFYNKIEICYINLQINIINIITITTITTMDSPMLKMLKMQNPDKEYISNTGLKWFEDEENILLEELNKNIDIETISQNHKRTIGGINSRRREIAYRMYLKNISMEEIIEKTKLDVETINQTIDRRKNYNSKKLENVTETVIENKKSLVTKNEYLEISQDIFNIKNDIKEIKTVIAELKEMLKAVYEFEDS